MRSQRFALIVREKTYELYDIQKDPSQKKNISNDNKEVAQHLLQQYQKWFADATKELEPVPDIPIDPADDVIVLPTYEASFTGNLHFKEGHGWVHDWLVNWKSKEDLISWEIQSLENTTYTFYLNYTCPPDQVGSEVQLSIGNNSIVQKIAEAFNPMFIPSPDRVKRKEVYEKTWKRMVLGTLTVPKGKSKIVVAASKIANTEVAEINSIELVKNP